MASETLIRELADELWTADRTSVPIRPLTDRHPELMIEDAYAIQSHNIQRRITAGAVGRGRKVGLTSLLVALRHRPLGPHGSIRPDTGDIQASSLN